MDNKGVNGLAIALHIISAIIALATSEAQTKKIIKTTKRYEKISLLVKGIGIVVASLGTLVILKKFGDEMNTVQEIRRRVR